MITTTPDMLVTDPRVPIEIVEWCFRRNEPRVELDITEDGLNCSVRSGSLTIEFDAVGCERWRTERARARVLEMHGRSSLTDIGGSLVDATVDGE